MTNAHRLQARIDGLTDHDRDRLLQAVLEALLAETGPLQADSEDAARELVAAFVNQGGHAVDGNAVVRPSLGLDAHVRATLSMLADDPTTAGTVEAALDALPEDSQMFAEPVTAALVLGVLVAFLQTRVNAKVTRRNGKVDFEFSLSKKAISDDTVGKVADAVRRAGVQ